MEWGGVPSPLPCASIRTVSVLCRAEMKQQSQEVPLEDEEPSEG